MGRPSKSTADYFPHMTTHKKTMAIIEGRWGNDAYAFWFKLLECLGNAPGHYIDCKRVDDWDFLYMNSRVSEQLATDILNKLSDLDAIDHDLWVDHRVIWSDNFVEGLRPLYQRRRQVPPVKPSFCNKNREFSTHKPEQADISTNINPITPPEIPTEIDKEKKSIVKKSRETTPLPPEIPTEKNEEKEPSDFEFVVQQLGKICTVNSRVDSDMVSDWNETMPRDWIEHAILIAKDQGGKTVKYVDTILQAWVAKYNNFDVKPWEVENSGRRGKNGLSGSDQRAPTAAEYERDRSSPGW